MSNNEIKIKELQIFQDRCEELIDSKFILADKKIASILKAIASSETLYNIIQSCTVDFDYERIKNECVTPKNNGSDSPYTLVLPNDMDKMLAFVFCLLVDFDNKRVDLHKFLQEFFYVDGSFYASFVLFCDTLIKPFAFSLAKICESIINNEEEKQAEIKNLESENLLKIAKIIDDNKKLYDNLGGISLEEKKELYDITDGLLASIHTFDKELIRLLFIGYKNTVSLYKKLDKQIAKDLEEVENTLRKEKIYGNI